MSRVKKEHSPLDCYTPLASRIRELRIKAGKTQTELGEILKVTKSNIANYEAGYTTPSLDSICELARYFHVSSDYLLGLSDAETNNHDEQFVCDYLGLSTGAIHFISDTKNNPYLHQTIEYLMTEQELLKRLSNYSWTRIDTILSESELSSIPLLYEGALYDSSESLHEEQQDIAYVHVLSNLNGYLSNMIKYYSSHTNMIFETILLPYIKNRLNYDFALQLLVEHAPDSSLIKQLFPNCSAKDIMTNPKLHTFYDEIVDSLQVTTIDADYDLPYECYNEHNSEMVNAIIEKIILEVAKAQGVLNADKT